MAVTLNGIKLPLEADEGSLRGLVAKNLGIGIGDVQGLAVKRISLDARKKNDIHFLYTVEAYLSKKDEARAVSSGKAALVEAARPIERAFGERPLDLPCIVVGLGPAGLFAALTLAENGYRPIVIERGKSSAGRAEDVERFRTGGKLNTDSNVMFGEGGAGAFSDGKLTTRIKDPRVNDVIAALVRFGAPEEIAVMAKPHIGTDKLSDVVSAIRLEIERLGGEVRFSTALSGIEAIDGRISAVKLRTALGEERLPCSACIAAIGHSADDTFEMLSSAGLQLTAKPFAMGVRIEHPRELIDASQFGRFMGHPRLGAAEYHFADKCADRGVYTFCMCPGGEVMACSNSEGRVITNGMSRYARDGANSNSAIVVQVDGRDYGEGPLAGLKYREKLERAAFAMGGGDYGAPIALVGDFLAGRKSGGAFGSVRPTYLPGVKPSDLSALLPDYMAEGIKTGIHAFGRKLRGFDMDDAVLTAIESRTSSPVRIERDELGEATRLRGFYPTGEGAGYAGGIVSAAVDGIRAAERIMAHYAPCSPAPNVVK